MTKLKIESAAILNEDNKEFFSELLKKGVDAVEPEMNKQLKKINEDRRIKCIYCKQPIHIDNFAGVNKKGMFCGKMECLIKLAKEY